MMFTTDEDRLFIRMSGHKAGWVRLIYGNDGWDVVNDYTTNLEPIYEGSGSHFGQLPRVKKNQQENS